MSLRCRVRKYESELQSLNLTLQGKVFLEFYGLFKSPLVSLQDNQIEELSKLCDELMQKNDISDDETMTENDNESNTDGL